MKYKRNFKPGTLGQQREVHSKAKQQSKDERWTGCGLQQLGLVINGGQGIYELQEEEQ